MCDVIQIAQNLVLILNLHKKRHHCAEECSCEILRCQPVMQQLACFLASSDAKRRGSGSRCRSACDATVCVANSLVMWVERCELLSIHTGIEGLLPTRIACVSAQAGLHQPWFFLPSKDATCSSVRSRPPRCDSTVFGKGLAHCMGPFKRT